MKQNSRETNQPLPEGRGENKRVRLQFEEYSKEIGRISSEKATSCPSKFECPTREESNRIGLREGKRGEIVYSKLKSYRGRGSLIN
jgi:hypothetical protein